MYNIIKIISTVFPKVLSPLGLFATWNWNKINANINKEQSNETPIKKNKYFVNMLAVKLQQSRFMQPKGC